MVKYQIRFCDSKGCGYFVYVDGATRRGIEKKAAEKATQELIRKYETQRGSGMFNPFFIPFKPMKFVNVWEWDTEKKEPKKGGYRFKLRLSYIEVTYSDKSKRREEWYVPVNQTK